MKTITYFLSFVLLVSIMLPSAASALSCMPANMMAEEYAGNDMYSIFTGVAGAPVEHVKQSMDAANPSQQYNDGFTAQLITVSESHKGSAVNLKQWVYQRKDATWGYMCSSAPAAEGEERVYVVNHGNGMFDLTTVVDHFPADSEMAKELLAAIDIEYETYVTDFSKEDKRSQLATELKAMLFIMRIKLAEWRWWGGQ